MPKDYLNKDINVGDLIVYPVRHGSEMWLNTMKVTGIEPRADKEVLVGFNPNIASQRRLTVKNTHTCVVVGK